MKVLIACEESQRVCIEMRKLGHEAYSCDIQEPSGGHPEWHILGDVLEVLNPIETICLGKVRKAVAFTTMDNVPHIILDKWDMIIAHPPCTYLTLAGNKWFKAEYKDRFPNRLKEREDAIAFFMQFACADCERIAIENPVCIMSSRWRKPDQYIEPYFFGDPEKKKTALWLKGLPPLKPTNIVEPVIIHCKSGANVPRWHMETLKLPKEERSRARSKTFPGIARAMAEQWAGQHIKSRPRNTANYKEDFMGNNARMTEQVKDKMLVLMKLASEYNRSFTEQKLTEDSPRFFAEFFPHTCELNVGVITGISRCAKETIRLTPRFSDDTDEEILAALGRWIDLFTSLYFGWRCAERANIYLDNFKGTELEGLLLDEQ